MKKVLIVDDEPLARAIIKTYLKPFSNLELLGECSDGFEAAKVIAETNPDLLFLDIQMLLTYLLHRLLQQTHHNKLYIHE